MSLNKYGYHTNYNVVNNKDADQSVHAQTDPHLCCSHVSECHVFAYVVTSLNTR